MYQRTHRGLDGKPNHRGKFTDRNGESFQGVSTFLLFYKIIGECVMRLGTSEYKIEVETLQYPYQLKKGTTDCYRKVSIGIYCFWKGYRFTHGFIELYPIGCVPPKGKVFRKGDTGVYFNFRYVTISWYKD